MENNFRTEQNGKKITFVNVIFNYAQDINKRIKLENKIHECECEFNKCNEIDIIE